MMSVSSWLSIAVFRASSMGGLVLIGASQLLSTWPAATSGVVSNASFSSNSL